MPSARQFRTCRRKTRKGNVHTDRKLAKYHAKVMAKKKNSPIGHYLCEVCGKWHLGRPVKKWYKQPKEKPASEPAVMLSLCLCPCAK